MIASLSSGILPSDLWHTTSPQRCAYTRSVAPPSALTILSASPDTRLHGEREAVLDSLCMPCTSYSQRGWFQAIEPLRRLDKIAVFQYKRYGHNKSGR